MEKIRAFVAVELPPEIRQKLAVLSAPLLQSPGSPVRWVRSGNIHLTLKFLGDSEPGRLESLQSCLHRELAGVPVFDVEVGGFGAFPNLNRPRVFWCGLEKKRELQDLYQLVESLSTAAGYQADDRPFFPHLTLGRAAERAAPADLSRVTDLFRRLPSAPLGTLPVQSVVLFRSQLKPGGSIYSPLFTIPLGGSRYVKAK